MFALWASRWGEVLFELFDVSGFASLLNARMGTVSEQAVSERRSAAAIWRQRCTPYLKAEDALVIVAHNSEAARFVSQKLEHKLKLLAVGVLKGALFVALEPKHHGQRGSNLEFIDEYVAVLPPVLLQHLG